MFQSHIHIQRRQGSKGTSRFQYLQDLVNEFQETQNIGIIINKKKKKKKKKSNLFFFFFFGKYKFSKIIIICNKL